MTLREEDCVKKDVKMVGIKIGWKEVVEDSGGIVLKVGVKKEEEEKPVYAHGLSELRTKRKMWYRFRKMLRFLLSLSLYYVVSTSGRLYGAWDRFFHGSHEFFREDKKYFNWTSTRITCFIHNLKKKTFYLSIDIILYHRSIHGGIYYCLFIYYQYTI
jgi:hypothetical protein